MTYQVPTTQMPSTLVVGDSWSWRVPALGDYPASSWTLSLVLPDRATNLAFAFAGWNTSPAPCHPWACTLPIEYPMIPTPYSFCLVLVNLFALQCNQQLLRAPISSRFKVQQDFSTILAPLNQVDPKEYQRPACDLDDGQALAENCHGEG